METFLFWVAQPKCRTTKMLFTTKFHFFCANKASIASQYLRTDVYLEYYTSLNEYGTRTKKQNLDRFGVYDDSTVY
jgi:hypothetical protein